MVIARVRRWGSLRQRLVAVGLLGLLCALLVAETALSSLARVDRSNQALTAISLAQRYQQDADMMHDAVRADVYNALLIGRRVSIEPRAQAEAELDRHLAQFRADLREAGSRHIDGVGGRELSALLPVLARYAEEAEKLARLALMSPADAGRGLPAFEQRFHALERIQARVTAGLAATEEVTKARAKAANEAAQNSILLASLGALAGLLGLAVTLDRMGKNLARLIARERSVAETLQATLLPDHLPELPGVHLAARYLPCGQGVDVGGDWYDVIALPTGEVGLIMGDVVGHDIRAAAVMGQLRNSLRAYAFDGLSPAATLERLNRLISQVGSEVMATCVYAVVDPRAATVCVANAGHYPPLLVSPAGEALLLEQPVCAPIGVSDATYTEKLYHLDPGAVLLLFTDGLVEQRGEPVAAGLDRVLACARTQPAGVEDLCDRLLATFFTTRAPADDVALLALQLPTDRSADLRLTLPASPTQLAALRRTIGRWLDDACATPQENYELTVACCEAASNAIEHAYGPSAASIEVSTALRDREVEITVVDCGRWRPPRGQHRGRGLSLIEAFTDTMDVTSTTDGTTLSMRRTLTEPATALPPPPVRSP
jgi:serine phosphatase RsbU (regulator of sigma subunit)/anti-sigma regulatory factor (Ser/Thr protein kinase)